MGDRFEFDIELPDVSTNPAAPAAGYLQFYGKSSRPTARNSAGRVFDLGNILESLYINGAANDRLRVEMHTVTTNGSGTATINFIGTFPTAPMVFVQAFTTLSSQPTIGEIVSVNTTQVSIKTYRNKTQGVLLGGTINPTQAEASFCHVMVVGVPT